MAMFVQKAMHGAVPNQLPLRSAKDTLYRIALCAVRSVNTRAHLVLHRRHTGGGHPAA